MSYTGQYYFSQFRGNLTTGIYTLNNAIAFNTSSRTWMSEYDGKLNSANYSLGLEDVSNTSIKIGSQYNFIQERQFPTASFTIGGFFYVTELFQTGVSTFLSVCSAYNTEPIFDIKYIISSVVSNTLSFSYKTSTGQVTNTFAISSGLSQNTWHYLACSYDFPNKTFYVMIDKHKKYQKTDVKFSFTTATQTLQIGEGYTYTVQKVNATSPTATLVTGLSYILISSGITFAAWSGKETQLAIYNSATTSWSFTTPVSTWLVYATTNSSTYYFESTKWLERSAWSTRVDNYFINNELLSFKELLNIYNNTTIQDNIFIVNYNLNYIDIYTAETTSYYTFRDNTLNGYDLRIYSSSGGLWTTSGTINFESDVMGNVSSAITMTGNFTIELPGTNGLQQLQGTNPLSMSFQLLYRGTASSTTLLRIGDTSSSTEYWKWMITANATTTNLSIYKQATASLTFNITDLKDRWFLCSFQYNGSSVGSLYVNKRLINRNTSMGTIDITPKNFIIGDANFNGVLSNMYLFKSDFTEYSNFNYIEWMYENKNRFMGYRPNVPYWENVYLWYDFIRQGEQDYKLRYVKDYSANTNNGTFQIISSSSTAPIEFRWCFNDLDAQEWSSTVTYSANAEVKYNSNFYRSLVSANVSYTPTNTTYWTQYTPNDEMIYGLEFSGNSTFIQYPTLPESFTMINIFKSDFENSNLVSNYIIVTAITNIAIGDIIQNSFVSASATSSIFIGKVSTIQTNINSYRVNIDTTSATTSVSTSNVELYFADAVDTFESRRVEITTQNYAGKISDPAASGTFNTGWFVREDSWTGNNTVGVISSYRSFTNGYGIVVVFCAGGTFSSTKINKIWFASATGTDDFKNGGVYHQVTQAYFKASSQISNVDISDVGTSGTNFHFSRRYDYAEGIYTSGDFTFSGVIENPSLVFSNKETLFFATDISTKPIFEPAEGNEILPLIPQAEVTADGTNNIY